MAQEKAKKIGISVPFVMWKKIDVLKDDLVTNKEKMKISEICEKAIAIALIEAEAHRAYRMLGFEDGRIVESELSKVDKDYIAKVLSKTGSYKKWSRFEKIQELIDRFESRKNNSISSLYPQFIKIMDGTETPLHEWVNQQGELIAQDRRSEVAWSYRAGCFEGILDKYMESIK